jgi:hypothetical protein
MIPAFNSSGVLPPFVLPGGVTDPNSTAPYKIELVEMVDRFGTSPERKTILRGLIDYRNLLRSIGITNGFQWVDGSYVENCEINRRRQPNDIDVVTFAGRPKGFNDFAKWQDFIQRNINVFDRNKIKTQYHCDAYYVDLELPADFIVTHTRYWFGLFSHQRITFVWKGLLEIPLQADDTDALVRLGRGDSHAV